MYPDKTYTFVSPGAHRGFPLKYKAELSEISDYASMKLMPYGQK